jgi:hypothetical protein
VTDEIAAIDWLGEFIHANLGGLSMLGLRWLLHAKTHLEDRVDSELRRTHGA